MNKKRALISVSDKKGIVEFANLLESLGYEIISTGGTEKTLTEAKIKVTPITEVTGNPESFDGRMKTISFQIESALLFDRTNPKHIKEAKKLGIEPIDIVISNLYPFEKSPSIENIDVGGPTMVRAAAKNHKSVLVITNPDDYGAVGNSLKKNTVNEKLRRSLAAKAFNHLSFYDAQIAKYLSKELFPNEIAIPGRKIQELRYGENPHQKAAYYEIPNSYSPLKGLTQLTGRGISYLNLTDINAGLEAVRLFKEPAAVVIKHNTPCGIATGKTISEALEKALDADPESAFGGTVVVNKPFDKSSSEVIGKFKKMGRGNMDIIAAPKVSRSALNSLKEIRKSTGVYSFGAIKPQDPMQIKFIDGGFILQTADLKVDQGIREWKVVSKKKPTREQMNQMILAWKFISRIKSNAVIVVDKKETMTRGIGSGQTSRVRSTKIALGQAKGLAKGGILASDSFFPFGDSVELAAKAGISAIVEQGGSVNDQASIDAADKAGIPLVFTHRRAFWH